MRFCGRRVHQNFEDFGRWIHFLGWIVILFSVFIFCFSIIFKKQVHDNLILAAIILLGVGGFIAFAVAGVILCIGLYKYVPEEQELV